MPNEHYFGGISPPAPVWRSEALNGSLGYRTYKNSLWEGRPCNFMRNTFTLPELHIHIEWKNEDGLIVAYVDTFRDPHLADFLKRFGADLVVFDR
jgi:hypothetical protein